MTAQNSADRPTAAEVLHRYNEETLPEFSEPLKDVNQVGTFGNRPLNIASYRGDLLDVVALVEGGAHVNAQGDLGSTPLHEAAEKDHIEVVRYLLERGADTNLKNEFGKTAFDVARDRGRDEIAKLLEDRTHDE